ncbi:MAG: OmpA family protein [Rhizomicrobium sp.]
MKRAGHMGLKTSLLLASALFVWPSIVLGQTVDRGNDVIVNPVTGGPGRMLLSPGGQYRRLVRPLLDPGEAAKDLGPIHLHMPTRSREARQRQAAMAEQPAREPKPGRTKAKSKLAAEPKPAKETRQAKAHPQPSVASAAPAYNPGFGTFDRGAAGLNLETVAPSPSSPPPPSQPHPARTAKANPAPVETDLPARAAEAPIPGLSKRSVILFAPQSPDPAQSALGAIKFLAGDLDAAMTRASSRVEIQAYGGNRGDKSSNARRLSLKRALAIRQVLIDDGVPAERIDVHAMGGADDSGPADRVDVYIKT